MQAGIQGFCVGYADLLCLRVPPRERVTFLSRQESNQRNAHPVARRTSCGSLRSSLKPGAAQLARIKKPIRAQTVLAHCSGLSGGARRAPTGELQQHYEHAAQFSLLIASCTGFTIIKFKPQKGMSSVALFSRRRMNWCLLAKIHAHP